MAGQQTDHAEARRTELQESRIPGRGCLRPCSVQRTPGRSDVIRPRWAARQMAMWARTLNPHTESRAVLRNTSWPVARAPESVGRARRDLTVQLTMWALHN